MIHQKAMVEFVHANGEEPTRKHLVVVCKELNGSDGFVLTASYTSVPSKRRAIVWKR